MANMKDLNKLINSPSVLLVILAGFFLCYMLKSYSNKQSMILSNFQQQQPQSSIGAPINSSDTPSSQSLLSNFDNSNLSSSTTFDSTPNMHDEINALLPNGDQPKANLLNPDQIIGMKGQVKRNQTFDLRGGIPVPKQMIPFNNPVAVADDVYTRGINTLS